MSIKEKIETVCVEKIKINTRKDDVRNTLYRLEEFLAKITKLSSVYEDLRLGLMTKPILEDALVNNAQLIRNQYVKQAEEDVKKIKNVQLRANLLTNIELGLKPFLQKVEELKRDFPTHEARNLLPFIEFENIWRISQDAEQRLNEKYSYYISEPEEIQLYQLHKAAAEAITAFLIAAPQINKYAFSRYFRFEENGVSPLPINYHLAIHEDIID